MSKNWTVQVPEDILNELSNSLDTICAVTELAEAITVEMPRTNDTYQDMRIRAIEGIFNLLTSKLKELDKQITDILDIEYSKKRKEV